MVHVFEKSYSGPSSLSLLLLEIKEMSITNIRHPVAPNYATVQKIFDEKDDNSGK